jgi:glycosyltransferase involved in cell wall biosynthesis
MLFSICIPSYKNPGLLERCLRSVSVQLCRDFEVILSDDTPDNSVKIVAETFQNSFPLVYQQQQPSLGSPANWNKAIDMAKGEFILLLHHDDWFASETVLSKLKEAITADTLKDVWIMDCYRQLGDGSEPVILLSDTLLKKVTQSPDTLILHNLFGPPSVVLVSRKFNTRYDKRFKWVVDIDYYISLLKTGARVGYIREPLMNIGIHEEQTTKFFQKEPMLVLREYLLLAEKSGPGIFKKISLYDFFWRMIRNNKIGLPENLPCTIQEIKTIEPVISRLLKLQRKAGAALLKNGFVSKFFMLTGYLSNSIK